MTRYLLGLMIIIGLRAALFSSSPLAAAVIPLSADEGAIGRACMTSFRASGPVTPACSCFARRTLTGLNRDERSYLLRRLTLAYGDIGAPVSDWSMDAVDADKVDAQMQFATRQCDEGKTGLF